MLKRERPNLSLNLAPRPRPRGRPNRADAVGEREGPGVRRCSPQAGATLIEVLVALGILASAIVILITGLSTGSFAVRSADTLTTASNLAAAQLESIKAQTYVTLTTYTKVAEPSGYTISIAQSLVATGLQQITVTVVFNGGSFKVSNYKVNR
jgi:type II secretory pathway pseudopilin PulG